MISTSCLANRKTWRWYSRSSSHGKDRSKIGENAAFRVWKAKSESLERARLSEISATTDTAYHRESLAVWESAKLAAATDAGLACARLYAAELLHVRRTTDSRHDALPAASAP